MFIKTKKNIITIVSVLSVNIQWHEDIYFSQIYHIVIESIEISLQNITFAKLKVKETGDITSFYYLSNS